MQNFSSTNNWPNIFYIATIATLYVWTWICCWRGKVYRITTLLSLTYDISFVSMNHILIKSVPCTNSGDLCFVFSITLLNLPVKISKYMTCMVANRMVCFRLFYPSRIYFPRIFHYFGANLQGMVSSPFSASRCWEKKCGQKRFFFHVFIRIFCRAMGRCYLQDYFASFLFLQGLLHRYFTRKMLKDILLCVNSIESNQWDGATE